MPLAFTVYKRLHKDKKGLFGICLKTILTGFSNSEFGLPATVGQLGLVLRVNCFPGATRILRFIKAGGFWLCLTAA